MAKTDHGIEVGQLTERVGVLSCLPIPGGFAWAPVRRTWAALELSRQRSVFCKTGFGARGAVLTLRRQELTLHNALEVSGLYILPTSITRRDRSFLEVHGAVCRMSRLTARPQAGTGRDALNRPVAEQRDAFSFPGTLTELYVRQEREEIAYTEQRLVTLVTPKVIALRAGDLVEQEDPANAGGKKPCVWVVRRVLDLEEYYNEYVLERQENV